MGELLSKKKMKMQKLEGIAENSLGRKSRFRSTLPFNVENTQKFNMTMM
jgi:hypothetical protein